MGSPQAITSYASPPEPIRRRLRWTVGATMLACLAVVLPAAAVIVRIEEPHVRIEWLRDVPDATLATLEWRYRLVDRERVPDTDSAGTRGRTWSYRLADTSDENVSRIFAERRIASVEGIDRERGAPRTRVRVIWRKFREWSDVVQLQSLLSLALGIGLIAGSFSASRRMRVWTVVGCLAAVLVASLAAPLQQRIRMGDVGTYTHSRASFERYMGPESVRFEAHLSAVLLRWIDRQLGATERTPAQAFGVLSELAAAWYALMLLLATWSGDWSPVALRYAGLSVAAPVTLMYFGYRELGYLSLNVAVFPLLMAGFGGARARFETGCALAGLGAALHGFGLLSLAGAALASLTARVRPSERVRLAWQAFAIGTSVYLIWIFVDVVAMGLSIVPGHAESIPWRSFVVNTLAEHRVNHAILSVPGSAEILVAALMVGLPLLLLVPAAVRRGFDTRPVLAYALPSVAFLVAFWPVQGLAVEADLIFAAFPAVYALIWLAAQRSATTWISLVLLATGHLVFWRAMLSDVFVNARVY